MRRLWETIGGIALAIVAVSCSNDSASHGCESPCEEPDAQACYTFGSGENSLVARAKCELDEKAGCFQWNFVEACNETCENDVCDPESKPEPPSPKPPSCTDGKYACFGKTLKQCKKDAVGETTCDTIKTCSSSCKATVGKCSEDLPSCTLTNGVTAKVRQWTDGDTVWVIPKPSDACNDYEFDAKENRWKQIRWRIRIHGIDAPECSKGKNKYYYYTCIRDSKYTNNNERYGYESWEWAQYHLLPFNSEIVLTCDEYDPKTKICSYDATADDDADADEVVYNRFLAYIGYSKNSASYDFSTELAREGLAFSNTKFKSNKRAEICAASKEAKDAKKNIWSLGNSVSEVLSKMGSTKKNGFSNMPRLCGW